LRYLEIALALMAQPKLLLLDEPAAGLNPQESERLMQIILRLREAGITVVLIEHNMNLVMSCCDRIVVLSFGKVLADGSADEIQANKNVVEVYLGGGISSEHP
jgi:ABC-type branched-subunit amino acid transport system ATPase component